MANCPKCNHKLRLIDWRQTCPECGANIVLYDLQERLMKDADKAEVQHYHFQKKIDRLKGAFVGSKLAIVRIFTSIFPLLAVLLPLVNITAKPPLFEFNGAISALTFSSDLSDKLDINVLLDLASRGETKVAAIFLLAFMLCLIISLVVVFVHFVCLMLACSPKGKVRNYTIDIIMLITALISVLAFVLMPDNSFISGSPAIGLYVYLALVIVCVTVDFFVFKQGIEINHQQCYVGGIPIEEYFKMVEDGISHEELRAEMYNRLNAIQAQKDAELLALEQKKIAEERAKEAVTADE